MTRRRRGPASPPQGASPEIRPRKDLLEQSTPLLPMGSDVHQLFICQTAPSFVAFLITYLSGLTMPWVKYRCVAITPHAIYVLESSKLSGGAKPAFLKGTMPRHTRLGPVSGRWAEVTLLNKRHWVHKRFHPQIVAADYEPASQSQALSVRSISIAGGPPGFASSGR